jgi:hypothetical protein
VCVCVCVCVCFCVCVCVCVCVRVWVCEGVCVVQIAYELPLRSHLAVGQDGADTRVQEQTQNKQEQEAKQETELTTMKRRTE